MNNSSLQSLPTFFNQHHNAPPTARDNPNAHSTRAPRLTENGFIALSVSDPALLTLQTIP